jgi:tetratricopeptide (TPR) repeat protein
MVVEQTKQDIRRLLRKRPGLWDRMNLPIWGYNNHIFFEMGRNCKELQKAMSGNFPVIKACLLTACYCDRKYVDAVLNSITIDNIKDEKQRLQAYFDIGMALYDIGYADGIKYIEKAIELENRENYKNTMLWAFTSKLNGKINMEKKIALAEKLILDRNKDYEKSNTEAVLAKAYIDIGKFDDAEKIVKKLVSEKGNECYAFLLAELCLAQKDFKAATAAFEKYSFPRSMYFWRAQYDYKKALAYYYAGQTEKCREQALKIRRRSRWDRFYRLEDIEDNGIKREPFIDEIISSDARDICIVDLDRINHYRRMLSTVFAAWIKWHPYLVAIILIALIFLLLCWFMHGRPIRGRGVIPVPYV